MSEKLEKENAELKLVLQFLLSWSHGSQCNDCTPFRAAPSDIEYTHHKECGHLSDLNKARALLKMPLAKGHSYSDPNAEMLRLANLRAARIK